MLARKLGRKKAHRSHMLRNLAASVILHEKVETTEAKAKEVKKLVESSITTAKKNTLAARRQLTATFFDDAVVDKLMSQMPTRFGDQAGGYTRLLRTGIRPGDGSDLFLITLNPGKSVEEKAEKPAKAPKAAKKEKVEATEAPAEEVEATDAN